MSSEVLTTSSVRALPTSLLPRTHARALNELRLGVPQATLAAAESTGCTGVPQTTTPAAAGVAAVVVDPFEAMATKWEGPLDLDEQVYRLAAEINQTYWDAPGELPVCLPACRHNQLRPRMVLGPVTS